MYQLFLDDLRDVEKYYPNQGFKVARSYYEAVALVQEFGVPEFISFDHDLGDIHDGEEMTGYSFAKYLINLLLDEKEKGNPVQIFEFNIHSSNPKGAINIETYLNNGFKAIKGD